MSLEILILDDEFIVGDRLKANLEGDDYKLETFTNPVKAIERIKEKPFDVVITDIRMDDMDGIEILDHVMEKSSRTKVIMITGYATLELARESMAKGAFDFIAKPFKLREVRSAVEHAATALAQEDELLARA